MDVFLGGNPQHGSGFPFDPRQKDEPPRMATIFLRKDGHCLQGCGYGSGVMLAWTYELKLSPNRGHELE